MTDKGTRVVGTVVLVAVAVTSLLAPRQSRGQVHEIRNSQANNTAANDPSQADLDATRGQAPTWAPQPSAISTSASISARPNVAVAVVNGHLVSEADLHRPIQAQLDRLEERLSQLRSAALEAVISEILVAQEAARLKVTSDQLVARVLSDVSVTDTEVTSSYEANRTNAGLIPEFEAREQIRTTLASQKRQQAYTTFVQRLRDRSELEVFLPASHVISVPVDLDKDPIRGAENAVVTILEFSDFECPFCKRAAEPLELILAEYPTQVRLIFKSFPLPNHAGAFLASQAALCAHDQGRFWDFHDALFSGTPPFDINKLQQIAKTLRLSEAQFSSCLDSGQHTSTVRQSIQAGRDSAVSATPTFIVNGRLFTGALGYDQWKSIVTDSITSRAER